MFMCALCNVQYHYFCIILSGHIFNFLSRSFPFITSVYYGQNRFYNIFYFDTNNLIVYVIYWQFDPILEIFLNGVHTNLFHYYIRAIYAIGSKPSQSIAVEFKYISNRSRTLNVEWFHDFNRFSIHIVDRKLFL